MVKDGYETYDASVADPEELEAPKVRRLAGERFIFPANGVACAANLSPCRSYRYTLRRTWDAAKGSVMVVGLNPSKADAYVDDATIAKLTRMVRRWNYGELLMVNLMAYRATNPSDLSRIDDPVGRDNDMYLMQEARKAKMIVCAWGRGGSLKGRDEIVKDMLLAEGFTLHALHLTKHGNPGHPLYLRDETKPFIWQRPKPKY